MIIPEMLSPVSKWDENRECYGCIAIIVSKKNN